MKVKNAFITKAVEDSADGDGVKNLKLQRVINGCVAYCVFSIIALVLFYYGNVVSYSYIYSVGIAIFIAFLINAACIVMYEQVQENANIEIYARMAYMDTMTGLGNRTAFLEENKSNAVFPGMISYIMMDANNLKKINDSLGQSKKVPDTIKKVPDTIKFLTGEECKIILFSDIKKIGLQIDKCTIFCYNNVQRKEELQCQ